MIKLTIVIVNYNVKHYISQCIDSVYKSTLKDIEVIVVDNHSHDGSVEYLKLKYPSLKIISLNHNLGFARANNIAIQSANGEYVLLLNPDTIVSDRVLQHCVEFMDAHPSSGGLGVKMLNVDGSKALESRRGLPTPLTSFYKMIGLCKHFPSSKIFGRYYLGYLPWDKPVEIEIVSGAFFMLRKEALDNVGLLDEDFFMYGEDIDLGYRLLKGGYQNWYIPETILHYKGESTQKSSFRYVHVFYEAMLIFFKKHYGHLSVLLSMPIKIAIYAKAFLALISMQTSLIKKNLGFVDKRKIKLPHYIFIGTQDSIVQFKKLAHTNGLDFSCYEGTQADTPNGHVSIPNLRFDKDKITYIVYDISAYSYSNVLDIFASSPHDNVEMAFYHPSDNILISCSEILK